MSRASAAAVDLQIHRARRQRAREERDHAAHRAVAVQARRSAFHDLDAVEHGLRHAAPIDPLAPCVVDRDAVEQAPPCGLHRRRGSRRSARYRQRDCSCGEAPPRNLAEGPAIREPDSVAPAQEVRPAFSIEATWLASTDVRVAETMIQDRSSEPSLSEKSSVAELPAETVTVLLSGFLPIADAYTSVLTGRNVAEDVGPGVVGDDHALW